MCPIPFRKTGNLSSFRDIAIAELGDRLAVLENPGRAGLLGRDQETLMPSARAGARAEHVATTGRLHHERLTDRVSWPKRELQATAFLSPDMQGP